MGQISISIIIPVLNGMPFIKSAMKSVLEQSIHEIEVLVVDAGSTDGTVELIEEMKKEDPRIKLFHSAKRSMGYQYNLGIQNAVGEFIGFCESDDYFATDMIEKLYKVVKENPTVDFVKSDFYMFFGRGDNEYSNKYSIFPTRLKKYYGKEVNIKIVPELLLRDVNMWNGIYRKDFLTEYEIHLNETSGAAFQDADFIEQVLFCGKKGIYITDANYYYRRDNETSSVYKDTAIFVLQELIFMIQFMKNHLDIKNEFGEMILDRLFRFFCDRYGRELYAHSSNSLDLNIFQEILREYVNELPGANRLHALNNRMLAIFLDDTKVFNIVCKKRYCCERKELLNFRDLLAESKRVAIWGAGELGQCYLAFLIKNGFDREIIFCDNNLDLQGTCIQECYPILSVEDAVKRYSDAIFLISNRDYFFVAKGQLVSGGIPGSMILEGPDISPHACMELSWNS